MKRTKEQIIQALKESFNDMGRIPMYKDFRTKNKYKLSHNTILKYFGTWNNALIASGLEICKRKPVTVICNNCEISFIKGYGQTKKSPRNFCSQNCAGTYHNQHRSHGFRVSKMELYLQKHLAGLGVKYNSKYCGYELDIFIPELDLAFEINGVFHYKPIYGQKKYEKILSNDNARQMVCDTNGIELIVINISHVSNFKPVIGEKILGDICEEIDRKLCETIY